MRAPAWGGVSAGLAASLAAAITGAVLSAWLGLDLAPRAYLWVILFFAFPIALGHAAIIGAPLYAAAIAHWPLRWWSAVLGGLVTGMLPVAVVALANAVQMAAAHRAVDSSGLLELLLVPGAAGAVGGLVFRALHGERLAVRT